MYSNIALLGLSHQKGRYTRPSNLYFSARIALSLNQRTHTKEALTRHATCDFVQLKRDWPLKLRNVYEVLLDEIIRSLPIETKGKASLVFRFVTAIERLLLGLCKLNRAVANIYIYVCVCVFGRYIYIFPFRGLWSGKLVFVLANRT
jgi:hypothetical protein